MNTKYKQFVMGCTKHPDATITESIDSSGYYCPECEEWYDYMASRDGSKALPPQQ